VRDRHRTPLRVVATRPVARRAPQAAASHRGTSDKPPSRAIRPFPFPSTAGRRPAPSHRQTAPARASGTSAGSSDSDGPIGSGCATIHGWPSIDTAAPWGEQIGNLLPGATLSPASPACSTRSPLRRHRERRRSARLSSNRLSSVRPAITRSDNDPRSIETWRALPASPLPRPRRAQLHRPPGDNRPRAKAAHAAGPPSVPLPL
jgi:hypothetical protein